MKKRLLFLFLMMAASFYMASAQNAIAIYQKSGEVVKFAFSEKPIVTYSGSNLVLTTTKTTLEYPIYLLKKMVLDVEWTESVDNIEDVQDSDIKFRFSNGTLSISGGQPGSIVALYHVNGLKKGQWRLDSTGCTNIPTHVLKRDVYIIKVNDLSFKFRNS